MSINEIRDKILPICYAVDIPPATKSNENIKLRVELQPLLEVVETLLIEARIETRIAVEALADMYGQYCDGPFGHDFMGAGEGAIEVLENYKLAKENKGVDYEALDGFVKETEQLQQSKEQQS